MKKNRALLFVGGFAAALFTLAVGCGDDDETGPQTTTPTSTGGGGAGTGGGTGGVVGGGGGVGGGGAGGGAVGGGGAGGGQQQDYQVEICVGAPTANPGADICAVNAGDGRLFLVGDVYPFFLRQQGRCHLFES